MSVFYEAQVYRMFTTQQQRNYVGRYLQKRKNLMG
jgi:hypothetical protein